jgi:methionyl-tRNA formyltransferase
VKKAIKVRAIFMGTSGFAASVLESLIKEKYNIVSVYTQPGKKSGREQSVEPSAVKLVAQKNSLPVFEPSKLDENVQKEIAGQKPDIIIVVAYGKIIPKNILDIPGFGIINVHASLLPKYRGPSPIQNALLNGDEEIGATIMLMNEGIDSGDILSQKSLVVSPKDVYENISEKVSSLSSKLLLKTLALWIERKTKPQKQDDSMATFCQLIERSDGKILWNEKASSIFNKFRAFHLWPGIFSYWENGDSLKRIKFNEITFQEEAAGEKKYAGEVFDFKGKIAIQTSKGLIFPEKVQLEGKKQMAISEFINGYPTILGSILK